MKISLIFTGLERTIDKTYKNLIDNLIDTDNTFDIYFITWKDESTEKFIKYFPKSTILYIEQIKIDNEEFQNWKLGLTIHETWLSKYKTNNIGLFRYFQQIYIWREASKLIESLNTDIYIRCRTDIIINDDNPKLFYDIINNSKNNIYFPNEPRHGTFNGWRDGCPDYIMIGKKDVMRKALNIIDYLHKYTYKAKCNNDIDNVIHPESSMYLFLKGENIDINFLTYSIHVIR